MSAQSPGPSTERVTGVVYLEEPMRSRIYGLDRSIAVSKQAMPVGTWVTFIKQERTHVDPIQDAYEYLTGAFEAVETTKIAPLIPSERLAETVKCTGKVRRLEWHPQNNHYRAESLEVGRVWIPPDNAVVASMRGSRSVSLKVAFCLDWTRKAFFAVAVFDDDDNRFRLLDQITKELATLIQGGSSPYTVADLLVDRFSSLRAVDESRRHATVTTTDDNNNAFAPRSPIAAASTPLTSAASQPRVPLGPRRLLHRPTGAVAPCQQNDQMPSTSGLSAAATNASEVPPSASGLSAAATNTSEVPPTAKVAASACSASRVKTVPFNLLRRLPIRKPAQTTTSSVRQSPSVAGHEATAASSTSVVQSPLVAKSILRTSRPIGATAPSKAVCFSDVHTEISDDDDVQSR